MPLFSILTSVLNVALGFVLRSLLVKFGTFFALWFITTEFVEFLLSARLFPEAKSLDDAFAKIPDGVWFWLELFAVSEGMPMILSAIATRFIIRRLPVIG
ncbi:hypothetical protein PPN31114_00277 [Pandoraea pneumonica]|jgi:hypothetical protein|uniref:DUF2523 domain-containing protein n=1 Tax=Pandoraea pneumonica TaxID=2508299 RepID=A0A5E4RR59_9BURK|nr:DUF2523 family protein [Pandoraea pneumonica]VVD64529.1 hypothetical protein PPN31114_00277 [Pandoraea pneumonica]